MLFILVVLTAGFEFVTQHPAARVRQINASGWRLYIYSFGWGVPFSAIGYLLTEFIGFTTGGEPLFKPLELGEINLNANFIVWAVITLSLAFLAGFISKKLNLSSLNALKKKADENDLKKLLLNSLGTMNFIQVTMTSRKVYVGMIVQINQEDMIHQGEFVKLMPAFSGYRDEKTLIIKLTNGYSEFYKKSFRENKEKLLDLRQRYFVIIPTSQIASVSLFEMKGFKAINESYK